MVHRALRIPVWLVVPALLATFVVGSRAGASRLPDVQYGFRIVTPAVSDVITQDVTPEIARSLHLTRQQGVVVSDVIGSQLYPGDVILSMNGNVVRCQADLEAQLSHVSSGQAFVMDVYRDGRIQPITVQRVDALPTVLPDAKEIRGIIVASLSTHSGVLVTNVQIGTPASDVGLKRGDVILDVDGHPVRSSGEFTEFVRQLNNGPAAFNVRHQNGQVDVFVTEF